MFQMLPLRPAAIVDSILYRFEYIASSAGQAITDADVQYLRDLVIQIKHTSSARVFRPV